MKYRKHTERERERRNARLYMRRRKKWGGMKGRGTHGDRTSKQLPLSAWNHGTRILPRLLELKDYRTTVDVSLPECDVLVSSFTGKV